jgi:hypothetical protein
MSVEGSWNVKMDTPMGTQQFTLNFSQSAGVWNGTLINERTGNSELSGLKVDGSAVSFETKVNSPMGSLKVTMNATVDGDAIAGVCKTTLGNANFTGKRA